MSSTGGPGGEEAAAGRDPCPRAAQLEKEIPYEVGAGSGRKRRECADAYLSCARSLLGGAAGGGTGGEEDEKAAVECLEKAASINGLWHACADACAQHARARQKSGGHADAVSWFGHALSFADRAGDSQGQKARKKRQALRDRCIECWEELVKAPVDKMDGPYRIALLADPSRAQTHIDMGYALAGRGLADRAAECYEDACRADPGSVEARFRAGTALEEAGDHARAAGRYEEAGGMDAGQAKRAAMGCAQCGRSLSASGRLTEAAEVFRSAARLDPAHAAECARAQEDAGTAVRAGGTGGGGGGDDTQYELPPHASGGAREGRAEAAAAAAEAGMRYALAAEWYQKAGAEDAAETARSCARCGRMLREVGMLEKAAAVMEAAAVMDAAHALECAGAHEEAAAAALLPGGGGKDRAASSYQSAARWYAGPAAGGGGDCSPIGDARGCLRCGQALAGMGRLEEAAEAIESAASLDAAFAPECAGAHERAAEAALRAGPGGSAERAAGHYTKAAAWHQKIPAQGGRAAAEAAEGCARCGRALAGTGRLEEAAEALGAAAAMDPAHLLECAGAHERCADEARSRRGGDAGESARHYAEAAGMYGRAAGGGREKAAAEGCARCASALGEIGRLDEAAEARVRASALDPSLALEQARVCAEAAGAARAGEGRGDAAGILQLALECCRAAGGAAGPEANMTAAGILLEQGRYGEAAAEYGRACAEDASLRPACADGCVKCADGLAGCSRIDEALACLQDAGRALIVGPEESEGACVRWGREMFDRLRYGEAARCFEAGVGAAAAGKGGGGGGVASGLGLAASLSRLGRGGEAVASYRRAQERAAMRRGGGGGWDDAAEAEARAEAHHAAGLSDRAGSCAAHLAIADALLGEGAHGEAEHWYARSRAIGTSSERSRAYAGIAQSLHARSMHEAAYGSLCMSGPGGTGRLRAEIGAGLGGAGRHDMAAKCYEAAAGKDAGMESECAQACMRIGRGLEERGMQGEAAAYYEAAGRIDAKSAEINFAIAGAAEKIGNYNRAELYYEKAGMCGGDRARADTGAAMCRARDLYDKARDDANIPAKRRRYKEAEGAYAEAIGLSPESPAPRIGAGKACLKQRDGVANLKRAEEYFAGAIALAPGIPEPYLLAGKAVRKHAQGTEDRSRYADALGYYDAAIERMPGSAIVPMYWRGLCMLCIGGSGGDEEAREFLCGALDGARPADSEERHYCGKICDILGRHGEAAEHYLASLRGSGLYSAGFYRRIDKALVRTGGTAGPGAPGWAGKADGGRTERGAGPAPQYVCDTNVVMDYLGHLARDTVFEGPALPLFEKRLCRIPQVCYNEAHGKVAGSEPRSSMLRGMTGLVTAIRGRSGMDACMQSAREAFMSAWLYSDEDAVREWCRYADEKAAKKAARYAGGPPTGRDVLVLATAIDMHGKRAGPGGTRLVTWDRDLATFGGQIRAWTGVEVVSPDDVGSQHPPAGTAKL